jgi:hypothetical protein
MKFGHLKQKLDLKTKIRAKSSSKIMPKYPIHNANDIVKYIFTIPEIVKGIPYCWPNQVNDIVHFIRLAIKQKIDCKHIWSIDKIPSLSYSGVLD